MAAPTAPRKNFITRDHRYVYLGGSFIALLGLGMFYSAPSPYSFIPAQSVFGTALAAICWFFLGVSAMALLVKWAYWNNYSSTIMKRPLIVRVSRYLSYLDAAACALLVLDRFILKLAYIINAAIHADSNPTDTLSMMAYMAYNQRSLFAIGISYTVRLALFGTAIAFVLALLMVFLRIQEPDKRDNDFVKFLKIVANKFSRFYIFVIRGTPMMVQSLILYNAVFGLFKRTGMSVSDINRVWPLFLAGLVTVSLNSTGLPRRGAARRHPRRGRGPDGGRALARHDALAGHAQGRLPAGHQELASRHRQRIHHQHQGFVRAVRRRRIRPDVHDPLGRRYLL